MDVDAVADLYSRPVKSAAHGTVEIDQENREEHCRAGAEIGNVMRRAVARHPSGGSPVFRRDRSH